ncbi:hypothetical protein [Pontibacter ramchanderi]|uniref:Outer membrane beta-barrel porin/alpha-amylase n=1 Tax=Pontibacter ramchanderi TaxID=1179743 RepID=A0A2N3UAT6_9BACT|nr:hypothetical protein [Pontibacter ramchanderi]PKV66471.1 hypothetical protein BD749_1599 [Pontibacter ramchanderi]
MKAISNQAVRLPQLLARLMLCALFLTGIAFGARAQTDTTLTKSVIGKRWIVETRDGSVIQGIYLGQTEGGIRLQTDSAGEVLIPHTQIKSTKIIEDSRIRDGAYWFENPNATRYLFSPSAFSLKKGEAYFQNTYLVLNSFHFGITDNFTMGGGFELISTFSGTPAFYIAPKASFEINDKWRAGGGLLYMNVVGVEEDFSGLGIGYGIATYGNTDDNVTLGLGYGFVDSEFSQKPFINLSGMKRISRRVGLVSENWLVPSDGYYGLISYGLRFMSERITVDLAFINNGDIAATVPIGVPYVDFVIKFGK